MKTTTLNTEFFSESYVRTYIDSIIFDNKEYIKEYGTIADYLWTDISNIDDCIYSYLRKDKDIIEKFDSLESAEQSVITDTLFDYIYDNYNYTIE